MNKLVIIVFSLLTSTINAQPLSSAGWDYPVKPGSEEWRVTSYAEIVKKSQPPKELLNSWDTETLFKYCVEYPFNKVIGMYNNPNDGFSRVYEQSTVWQEFAQHKDALRIIISYFEDRPYIRLFEMKDIRIRSNELFTLYFLEKFVSETDLTEHLDASDKRKLANTILQSHNRKKDHPDMLFGIPYNSSLCALLKILESDYVLSPHDEISLTKFRKKTQNEYLVDEETNSIIISKVIHYISK